MPTTVSLSKLSSMQTHSRPCKPILIPMHIFTPNHPSYPFLSLNSHPCKPIPVHASSFSFPCKPILIPIHVFTPNHSSYPFLSLNSHPCKPIFIPMQTHSHSHAHIHTQPSFIHVSLSKLSSMQTHSCPCKPILIPMHIFTPNYPSYPFLSLNSPSCMTIFLGPSSKPTNFKNWLLKIRLLNNSSSQLFFTFKFF